MTVVVAKKPFPWLCHNCGSIDLIIRQTHNANDPQEITISCAQCGTFTYTSGEPIFIDLNKGECRELNEDETVAKKN